LLYDKLEYVVFLLLHDFIFPFAVFYSFLHEPTYWVFPIIEIQSDDEWCIELQHGWTHGTETLGCLKLGLRTILFRSRNKAVTITLTDGGSASIYLCTEMLFCTCDCTLSSTTCLSASSAEQHCFHGFILQSFFELLFSYIFTLVPYDKIAL
jgi:hypothetical protein